MSDPQVHHEQDKNWLKRFLARVMRQKHGDIIAVNIGEGARNVAVGRFVLQNNLQIGTLVIPVRFILALLAVALVLAIVVWYVTVPAQMPKDTFNVAVADFGQMDKDGQVHSSRDGSNLSQWMFGKMQSETTGLPQGVKVQVWHDSLGLLRKRSTIGVISTEAQAAARARQINAHMVVYGALQVNQDPATFVPKFYVADVLSETSELVGGQQLGAPITLRTPLDFNDVKTGVYLDQNLKPRAQALVWFTHGLAFDLIGEHAQALQVFREAEQQLKTWPANQGQEILYVFMGREAMFLAHREREAQEVFGSVGEAVAFAEGAFNQALTINPTYDRAHLWLGNVYFQKAQATLGARQLGQAELAQVRSDLDQATAQYREALRDAESLNSIVGVRTQIMLGMVDYLRGAAFLLTDDSASADPLYQSAIDQIEKALPSVGQDQHRILAQTYQALGAAYFSQGYANLDNAARRNPLWDKSSAYFDQCLRQVQQDPYDAFLQDLKQYCSQGLQELKKAQEQHSVGS
jgi:tetratricopeptide (TPR) repeat protein